MLKKYLNKIPALLGGLFLAVVSSQAVAVTGCGNMTGVVFTSLDANVPVQNNNQQNLSANAYTGKIQVTIISRDSTDVSTCGWILTKPKQMTTDRIRDLTSGKLYGNQIFTYSVPISRQLPSSENPIAPGYIHLTFDGGYESSFSVYQGPIDPSPTIPNSCDSGKTYRSGLCYTDCRPGYSSDGMSMCYQNCPSDMSGGATTTSCTKKSYDRGVGIAAKIDNCGRGNWKCNHYVCKSNRELQSGLCYEKGKDGYSCNATTCWQSCPSGMKDFGVGCTKDSYSVGTGVAPGCPFDKFRHAELCYRKHYRVPK